MSLDSWIEEAAVEVQRRLDEELARVGTPPPESGLASLGLGDVLYWVRDYLQHNERGLAWEHLVTMIIEADLVVSAAVYERIVNAGLGMGHDPKEWRSVKHS